MLSLYYLVWKPTAVPTTSTALLWQPCIRSDDDGGGSERKGTAAEAAATAADGRSVM